MIFEASGEQKLGGELVELVEGLELGEIREKEARKRKVCENSKKS